MTSFIVNLKCADPHFHWSFGAGGYRYMDNRNCKRVATMKIMGSIGRIIHVLQGVTDASLLLLVFNLRLHALDSTYDYSV